MLHSLPQEDVSDDLVVRALSFKTSLKKGDHQRQDTLAPN